MRGPIDYIIVAFAGKKFDGSVLKALEEPVAQGVIALIGMRGIQKDADGTVTEIDLAAVDGGYRLGLERLETDNEVEADPEDVSEVGELIENDTMAGLLVIEHLWAKPLKRALLDANGVLLSEGRIHPDAARELSNT